MKHVWRNLLRSTSGQAVILGLTGTILAWSCWFGSPAILTALDWLHYDAWLSFRGAVPVSPSIVLITRDEASEARFGQGPWDRALFARVVTALDRAGASVVALDVPIEEPSPPGRGGASSDAMLAEATRNAENVVFPVSPERVSESEGSGPDFVNSATGAAHSSWPMLMGDQGIQLRQVTAPTHSLPSFANYAAAIGHVLVAPDKDAVTRRIPLYVVAGDRAIPAFGLVLAETFLSVSQDYASLDPDLSVTLPSGRQPDGQVLDLELPIGQQGQMLVNFSRSTAENNFLSLSFLDVWSAIEQGDTKALRQWVEGKIAVVVPTSGSATYRSPLGSEATGGALHVHLLNTLLTRHWVREAPLFLVAVGTLLLSILAAWLLLSSSGWKAPLGAVGIMFAQVGLAVCTLSVASLLIPLFTPVLSVALASAGATVWVHLTASSRIWTLERAVLRVQQELVVARETLAAEESAVEDLEEDLETARAALCRSENKEAELTRFADELRDECGQARALAEATRQRCRALEQELDGLRGVIGESKGLADREQERLRRECEDMDILTRDPKMLAMFRDLKKAARSSMPVLILGEPGTGKELFARAVHSLSARAARPFVAVNMAAISPELFESELFGHVKGSFTGALADRKGYFELADSGTIFLDEIGDLQYEHQGKLLRVLQERTFYRVGATKATTVDLRVVAATNRNLQREVSEGWFREDLYFRLKGVVLRLPPLRERRPDIPLLAERVVRDAAREVAREDLALSREALAVLERHAWRGNIRELQQCLQQAVALAEGMVITKEDLRLLPPVQGDLPAGEETVLSAGDLGGDQAVLTCLRHHEFDMQAAAHTLGWDRGTVTQRLKGMSFRALVEARGDQARAALTLAGDPALARRVEMKLQEYYQHLIKTIRTFQSANPAVAACRKRFKNLPDRHFRSVEVLVRQYFDQSARYHSSGQL